MIVWLASYPKSGNTLVRSFIYSLLFSNDGNPKLDELNRIKQFPNERTWIFIIFENNHSKMLRSFYSS